MLHHSPGQAEGPAKKQHVIARSGATWQSPAQLYKFVLRTGRLPRLRLAMTWLISVAVSVQTGWSSYRGGRDDVQCPTIRILLDCRQAESTTVCPPGLPAPKTAQSAQCPTTRVLLDCDKQNLRQFARRGSRPQKQLSQHNVRPHVFYSTADKQNLRQFGSRHCRVRDPFPS